MAWMICRIELSRPPGVSSCQHHQRRTLLRGLLHAAHHVVGAGRADGVLQRQHGHSRCPDRPCNHNHQSEQHPQHRPQPPAPGTTGRAAGQQAKGSVSHQSLSPGCRGKELPPTAQAHPPLSQTACPVLALRKRRMADAYPCAEYPRGRTNGPALGMLVRPAPGSRCNPARHPHRRSCDRGC
jgi:hypothetical protein